MAEEVGEISFSGLAERSVRDPTYPIRWSGTSTSVEASEAEFIRSLGNGAREVLIMSYDVDFVGVVSAVENFCRCVKGDLKLRVLPKQNIFAKNSKMHYPFNGTRVNVSSMKALSVATIPLGLDHEIDVSFLGHPDHDDFYAEISQIWQAALEINCRDIPGHACDPDLEALHLSYATNLFDPRRPGTARQTLTLPLALLGCFRARLVSLLGGRVNDIKVYVSVYGIKANTNTLVQTFLFHDISNRTFTSSRRMTILQPFAEV